jgi:hypothetical protein
MTDLRLMARERGAAAQDRALVNAMREVRRWDQQEQTSRDSCHAGDTREANNPAVTLWKHCEIPRVTVWRDSLSHVSRRVTRDRGSIRPLSVTRHDLSRPKAPTRIARSDRKTMLSACRDEIRQCLSVFKLRCNTRA